jgi:hypothetical protein
MKAPLTFHAQQQTVGGLIALLESCDKDKPVAFDFCGFAPNGIHPRRPFGDLALGYADMRREQWPTVEQLRGALYGAIHQQFHCPDGSFAAKPETPLWVGNGYACHDGFTLVTGLDDFASVWLRTAHMEVWS